MPEEKKEIELRSTEYQEILGQTPSWLVRSGTQLIACIIVLFLIASFIIKYPDVIMSQIVITTENPPAPLKAQTTGKLVYVFAGEKQKVNVGEVVAVLENSANYYDYVLLREKLDSVSNDICAFRCKKELSLGECQTAYANFLQTINILANKHDLRIFQQQIIVLKQEIRDQQNYKENLQKQAVLLNQNAELAKSQRERNEYLFQQGALSKYEHEQSEQNFLSQKLLCEEKNAQISSVELQINKLNQEILELKKQETEDYRNSELSVDVAYKILLSELNAWEKKYLLISPINGNVTFSRYWNTNQAVQNGELVATIIPEKQTNIIGKLYISSDGMGKVKEGQRVNIKLDNFPYMEYGFLEGKIKNISLIPITEGIEGTSQSIYCAEVELNSLKSNYKKELTFTQEMSGVGEIITEDLRLIERLLYPVKSIWKEYF